MTSSKALFFLLELINCYAVVYYSNFLFFYMKAMFGFGELENLLLAALNGIVYAVAAWQGGAFAQRFGCVRSLYIGFGGLAATLLCALCLHAALGQVVVFAVWSVFVCFTWPALEAIVSDKAGSRLSDMVGIYNVTWAASSAAAYFTAGILLEQLGMQSLFWVPLCLHALQIALLPLTVYVAKRERHPVPSAINAPEAITSEHAGRFMHMAWIANPLSYVAINTILPLIPSIAGKLGLSTATAGIACSVWMFARLGVFVLLWRWTGWHYRFRWLGGAFVLMAGSFALLLHPGTLAALIAAQIAFGLTVGLIYYSSLYYSMNASEEKGVHSGLHEAMIGAGLFVGPACGATSLLLFPAVGSASTLAVSGVLLAGFSGILWLGRFRIKTLRGRQ
ncbi:MAG: MFS transporter [Syntrophales bacterium]|nr:MFS transporter [Syntrophales bacterium]MDP3096632.1 MFS transporter [Syntrophales bacterium]